METSRITYIRCALPIESLNGKNNKTKTERKLVLYYGSNRGLSEMNERKSKKNKVIE